MRSIFAHKRATSGSDSLELQGPRPRIYRADIFFSVGFLALGLVYFYGLTSNLINDDEGSYLYAAWRISLGELPYRDFLTPQLPGFLLPGGLLMKVVGPAVWPARALAVATVLGAALFLWRTARHLFGPLVAALASLAFLMHPLVYQYARVYRSEPFMLFFGCVGVYAVVRAYFPFLRPGAESGAAESNEPAARDSASTHEPVGDPRPVSNILPSPLDGIAPIAPIRQGADGNLAWILVAGFAFGMAVLCKFYGALPLLGCGFWILVDGLIQKRPMRRWVSEGLLLGGSAVATALAVLAYFNSQSERVGEATVGHHLMQNGDSGAGRTLLRAFDFYVEIIGRDQGSLLLFGALAAAIISFWLHDRRGTLFACQMMSLAGFALLSRDLFRRHLMYLLPALCTLVFIALVPQLITALRLMRSATRSATDSSNGKPSDSLSPRARNQLVGTGLLSTLLIAGLFVPWLSRNIELLLESEDATPLLADFIQLTTDPEDDVFGDFSELNFYGLRPTSYEGASLSAGAAKSGQLAWKVLEPALTKKPPVMLLNLDPEIDQGHLRHMPDHADYLAWADTNYRLLGRFVRDWQDFDVLELASNPVQRQARFTDGPALLASEILPAEGKDRASSHGDYASGSWVAVRTAWQNGAPEEAGTKYVATLRLLDLAGRQWSQLDESLFSADGRKTPEWLDKELSSQRIRMDIPSDAPPGIYRVELGMYRRHGDALMLLDAEDQPYHGRVHVGDIRVGVGAASMRELPERADIVKIDRFTVGGFSLLGHSALPSDTIEAGRSQAFELWWRLEDENVDPNLRLAFAPGFEISPNALADGGPSRPGAWNELPPGIIYRQKVWIPVGDPWLDDHPESKDEVPPSALRIALVPDPNNGMLQLGEWPSLDTGDWVRPAVDSMPEAHFGGFAHLPDRIKVQAESKDDELSLSDHASSVFELAPGRTLDLAFEWTAAAADPGPWRISLQLLDSEMQSIAQVDAGLGNWEHPTATWLRFQQIEEAHSLEIPISAEPGDYRVALVLYQPDTGWRLPFSEGGDMALYGTIRIRK